jgi:ABC-2 type transport system permease protein
MKSAVAQANRLIADTVQMRWRGAVIWVLGGSAAMYFMALALRSEMARFEGGREGLAASVQAGAEAMRLLRWPAERLDTLGGYLTYHNLTLFAYFLSLYAVVQASRAIRGAETSQALEPVLATGRTRAGVLLARATGFALVLLAISIGLGLGIAVAMAAGGEPNLAGSLLTSLAMGVCAFVAYALGAAISQLIGTARSAAGVGAFIVTVLYLLTNVWDRIGPVGVIRFVSPFYYFGQSRVLVPGHGFGVLAVAVSLGMAVALLAVAAWAFERRDVGAPLWVRRARHVAPTTRVQRPALRALWSATVVRERTSLLVWCASVAVWMGLMAWLEPNVIDVWNKFDFARNLTAIDPRFSPSDHYLSFAAEILAPIVAALVVTRAAGWVADLQQGRVEIVLSAPLSWAGLVGQRLAALLAEAAVVVTGGITGLVIGALVVGADLYGLGLVRLAAMIYLLAAGLGALAALLVAWLRTAVAVTALSVCLGASYLFVLLVQLFGWPDWLTRVSIFGAVGHPYLQGPPVEGLVFLSALAVVGTTLAAVMAQRSAKVR